MKVLEMELASEFSPIELSSVVEHLPSMSEALGSIPTTVTNND
jgi:hypothetical protein